VAVRGSPGLGTAYAALPGDRPVGQVIDALAAVRTALAGRDGTATVLTCPPALRGRLDFWGDAPDLSLQRRFKRLFDPAGTLAPGRSPSGL
jgi:glycolate oxidase FAD binding subunit